MELGIRQPTLTDTVCLLYHIESDTDLYRTVADEDQMGEDFVSAFNLIYAICTYVLQREDGISFKSGQNIP